MRRSRCIANSPGRIDAAGRALLVLILLLALATAGAWWYFAPQTLPALVQRQLPKSPKANPPLYEWRDAQDHLHVTDAPPPNRPYKTLRFDPEANVLPSGVAPHK